MSLYVGSVCGYRRHAACLHWAKLWGLGYLLHDKYGCNESMSVSTRADASVPCPVHDLIRSKVKNKWVLLPMKDTGRGWEGELNCAANWRWHPRGMEKWRRCSDYQRVSDTWGPLVWVIDAPCFVTKTWADWTKIGWRLMRLPSSSWTNRKSSSAS